MDFFSPERVARMKAMTHNGKPFVLDQGNLRTLHFNEHEVQSAMYLSDPDELVIDYTRAMAALLELHPAPREILMVGLGGGSLAKHCHRRLPETHVTVLESNADVIALRGQFMIPADDARLRVLHADAAVYVQQSAQMVDAILVDGFDAGGVAAQLTTDDFYAACRGLLRPQGLFIANMAGDGASITTMLVHLSAVFGSSLRWFRTSNKNSYLVLAFNGAAVDHVQVRRLVQVLGLELLHPAG